MCSTSKFFLCISYITLHEKTCYFGEIRVPDHDQNKPHHRLLRKFINITGFVFLTRITILYRTKFVSKKHSNSAQTDKYTEVFYQATLTPQQRKPRKSNESTERTARSILRVGVGQRSQRFVSFKYFALSDRLQFLQ